MVGNSRAQASMVLLKRPHGRRLPRNLPTLSLSLKGSPLAMAGGDIVRVDMNCQMCTECLCLGHVINFQCFN